MIVLDFDLEKETDPIWLNYYLTPAVREAIGREYHPVQVLQVPEPERLWPQDRFYIYVPRSGGQSDGNGKSQSLNFPFAHLPPLVSHEVSIDSVR